MSITLLVSDFVVHVAVRDVTICAILLSMVSQPGRGLLIDHDAHLRARYAAQIPHYSDESSSST